MPGTPAVSHVRLIDLDGDGRLDLLGTDMRHGTRLQRQTRRSRGSTGRDCQCSAPGPCHRCRRRSGRHQGSAGGRDGRVLSGRSREGRRHLDARPAWRQVRRILARRLAAGGERRRGGLQRRRQDRSRRRRVRVAQDRTGRDPREPHGQPFSALLPDSHDRSACRQHPASCRSI